MNISWHGLSCFSINTKHPNNGEVTLVIDPYDNVTGLRFPRTVNADVAAVSHDESDANNVAALQGNPFIIKTSGEYEVKGIFVYGIVANCAPEKEGAKPMANQIFRIMVEDVNIAHLGALNRELTDNELKQLQNIDIIMIPVGGGRVMSPKVAVKVIGQIDPRVVLPMSHAVANLKEKYADVKEFCKEIGVCQREETTKYKVTRSTLPEEETEIIVLTRS
ncbi:MBL fold metallo-hydrolase [Patescibacteria group bacterium]|nr:MBL fold metallo-hydrolase [Patescibacteria group bacterium]MBU1906884.1 MBL fold metallo-hydrolase [Patescibacteria group bacterium]